MTDHDDDVLGVEDDRRKLNQEAPPEEGPAVAQMATTYGSSLVDAEHVDRLASDTTDGGDAPGDGLGRPQPPSESTGQG